MNVTRHYFVNDDLDELSQIETELETKGIDANQIHVLSLDDSAVERRVNLNDVTSLMKQDIVRSGELGLGVGVVLAAATLGLAYVLGWTNSAAGWIPFIFLAIVFFGFSTWQGGFIGIQRRNKHFVKFEDALNAGRHVFFVDAKEDQLHLLDSIVLRYPSLERAGTESGTPEWILKSQRTVPKFLTETLP